MDDMSRATQALRAARKVVFFTGAGISAESGIPTFRDKLTGLWAKHDPQRLETAAAFRENPSLVGVGTYGVAIRRSKQNLTPHTIRLSALLDFSHVLRSELEPS